VSRTAALIGSVLCFLLALVLVGLLVFAFAPCACVQGYQEYDEATGEWSTRWVSGPGAFGEWYYDLAGYPLPLPFGEFGESYRITGDQFERDGVTYVQTTIEASSSADSPIDRDELGWSFDFEPEWDEDVSHYTLTARRGRLAFSGEVDLTQERDVRARYEIPLDVATGDALRPFPPSRHVVFVAVLLAAAASVGSGFAFASKHAAGHG